MIDKTKDLSDFKKRQIYSESLDNLRKGALTKFNKNRKKLKGYVLEPYLEYHRINGKLNNAGSEEVETFLENHSDLAPSPILKIRCLKSASQTNTKQVNKHMLNEYIKSYKLIHFSTLAVIYKKTYPFLGV